jgi:hypothetical protein
MRALDQNQISNRTLITACQDSFLIPDITLFENIKSDGWRVDVLRSFEVFHEYPSRLHIAYSVGELLRRELQSHTPTRDPVNWEGTRRLRELLSQTDYVTAIETNVEALRHGGLDPVIHLTDNRQSLSDGMAELAKRVGSNKMSQLRSLIRSAQPRLAEFAPCIATITRNDVEHTLTELGVLDAGRINLNTHQSAFYRMQFCFWAQVFQYAMFSTSLPTGDSRLLNDIVDSDYAITASYCDSLETNDNRLCERYDALMAAIRQSA